VAPLSLNTNGSILAVNKSRQKPYGRFAIPVSRYSFLFYKKEKWKTASRGTLCLRRGTPWTLQGVPFGLLQGVPLISIQGVPFVSEGVPLGPFKGYPLDCFKGYPLDRIKGYPLDRFKGYPLDRVVSEAPKLC
jgi:hypothetical protein